ncbi:hypothetical protein SCACP_01340 [Sporomusa carbonis]|uniref:hypothetical protein n=1 Tax=Sporomusa carbonis TaxID=3076075 RepID=UPI003A6E407D
MTRMMLSYLLTNFLIDCHQYEIWRGLGPGELKDRLLSEGIMTSADFDNFSSQITAVAEMHNAQGEYGCQDAGQYSE